jgi:alpha-N-arabinofuranosidase
MKFTKVKHIHLLTIAIFLLSVQFAHAQTTFTLKMDSAGANVSPTLYGLMTEEINHAFDGGLYAEMIRNRSFTANAVKPEYWSLLSGRDSKGSFSLDYDTPFNKAIPVSLKLIVNKPGRRMGLINNGYWGMAVRPNTTYKGSFYGKANGTSGTFIAALENTSGSITFASATIKVSGNKWKKYQFTLRTNGRVKPTKDARFVLYTHNSGTWWFSTISLFPPTYKNTPNGNRKDLMRMLANMKPSFLRFPGGNYLEGNDFANRFDWKKTIGPIIQRPGHESPWRYHSTDGMGLLEFLEWCQDLNMQPLLAVFDGYSLHHHYVVGKALKPYVQSALDEIQYVIGGVNTKWGAVRAKDGHPKPFKLHYVEIGNEDFFDRSGSYARRFTQFYKAIKAKYPKLKIISSVSWRSLKADAKKHHIDVPRPDVCDEHYYRSAKQMFTHTHQFDHYSRSQPKILVGEWATREGSPTTDFNAALGDAAWMTGMERNSDLVIMASYAPLFVNVSPGAMQWRSDLIGYNALNSYGSPSYYAQRMFSNYLGNKIVPIAATGIPFWKGKNIPSLFYDATTDTKTGDIYLKVVNIADKAQPIKINLEGKARVKSKGLSVVLKAKNPKNTNTIQEPKYIVPVKKTIHHLGKSFDHTFPAYSITVLDIKTK